MKPLEMPLFYIPAVSYPVCLEHSDKAVYDSKNTHDYHIYGERVFGREKNVDSAHRPDGAHDNKRYYKRLVVCLFRSRKTVICAGEKKCRKDNRSLLQTGFDH